MNLGGVSPSLDCIDQSHVSMSVCLSPISDFSLRYPPETSHWHCAFYTCIGCHTALSKPIELQLPIGFLVDGLCV